GHLSAASAPAAAGRLAFNLRSESRESARIEPWLDHPARRPATPLAQLSAEQGHVARLEMVSNRLWFAPDMVRNRGWFEPDVGQVAITNRGWFAPDIVRNRLWVDPDVERGRVAARGHMPAASAAAARHHRVATEQGQVALPDRLWFAPDMVRN